MERMKRALEELNVGGVRTSAPAALAVLAEPEFRAGQYTTHFLESLDLKGRVGPEERLVAALAAVHRRAVGQQSALAADAGERRGWLARSRDTHSDHARRAARRGDLA